jgi:Uma2 family endonuclease
MEEYMANGAQLGWLLDTKNKRVYIYRSTQPVQRLENPNIISGDPILPGFVLDLHDIW